jgi:ketosteroid isomerase-like protein
MTPEQSIIELEHGLMTALQHRDAAALKRYVGDDYTMTAGVTGREVRTREDWMRIGLEEYVIDEFEFEEMVVQHYGTCAIARSRFRQRAEMNGSRRNSTYRMTDVWIRNGDVWQIQARHSQRVEGD